MLLCALYVIHLEVYKIEGYNVPRIYSLDVEFGKYLQYVMKRNIILKKKKRTTTMEQTKNRLQNFKKLSKKLSFENRLAMRWLNVGSGGDFEIPLILIE